MPSRFLGLTPVKGSLSSLVPVVGLVAYFGIDPAFDFVRRTRAFQEFVDVLSAA